MLYTEKARITRNATAVIYCLVLALLVGTTFVDPPAGVSVPLMLAVKLIPLLPFAWVVFRGHNRGYIWMNFVVIFYFTQAVVSAWLSEGAALQVLMAVLTFLLFSFALLHLKRNRRQVSHREPA